MNKRTIIISLLIFIIACILLALVGYFNHEEISSYIENDMWTYKEPFEVVTSPDITNVYRNSNLVTYTADGISFYNSNSKLVGIKNVISTSLKNDSKGSYLVLLFEDTNTLTLYKDSDELWSNVIKNDIKQISVNKNGYVAVCFSQTGYKSGVTVYSPNGENVLTTYLASTYAIDATISNDNKKLAIAQVNISGIKPKSSVKIIDMQDIDSKSKEVVIENIGHNEIVTDIEYSYTGNLLILTDMAIYSYTNQIAEMFRFDEKYTLYAKIDDLYQPFVIEQNTTDLYSYSSKIKTYHEEEEVSFELESIPQCYDSLNGKIALVVGDEIIILNSNLTMHSRIRINSNIISIKFIKDAKVLAIIYKDKIEFVRL